MVTAKGFPVKVMKIRSNARLPGYATEGSACFDFYSCVAKNLLSGRVYEIPTGLAFEVPSGYMMEIRPRSGLSAKGVILVNAPGTIDSDYRGEIMVLLYNTGMKGKNSYKVNVGDRIAQGRIVWVGMIPTFQETAALTITKRGDGGFGSTGV